jgi:hypothetical protein
MKRHGVFYRMAQFMSTVRMAPTGNSPGQLLRLTGFMPGSSAFSFPFRPLCKGSDSQFKITKNETSQTNGFIGFVHNVCEVRG